jgi:excisionase family DNA binding protein
LVTEAVSVLFPQSAISSSKEETKYLTRIETASLLQISLPTLHDYTKRGVIHSYRIGSNVRYKPSDIELALRERNYSIVKKGGKNAS